MTGSELALARHRLYALLGWLLVDGVVDATRGALRAVPALSALADLDPDSIAADHHALTTEVPPVLSAVLGEEGLVGGPLQDEVRRRFADAGFHPGRSDVAIDHLGLLLACLGHLCAAEHELLEDGGEPAALRAQQRRVLDDLVLSWLPAWVVATRGAGGALDVVSELALEACLSHRADLGPATAGWRPTLDLPDLAAEDTDLRGIGEALARPARSGWLPGRRAIHAVARAAGVVAGFGSRAASLGETLLGAADLGRLGALLEGLDAELGAWDAALAELDAPVAGWREGAARTRAWVGRLAVAVAQADPGREAP